jgi:hypothetical protein
MRVNDLIVESQQLDELTGAGLAKGVNKVTTGLGAVAGGVRGAVDAAKKGFQAGRAAVAGGGAAPEEDPATTAADANKQGPAGTAPAQTQTGAAGTALAKSAQAVAGAGTDKKQGDALYAQIKASIGQLDPAGKKKILQLVQKSLAEKPPAQNAEPKQSMADKIAAAQGEKSAAEPAAEPATDSGAIGAMANQLGATPNTMANAPVSKTNTAKPGNPNAVAEPAQQAAAPAAEPAQQQTGGKLTAAQQAAMKAKLKGQRAAGQTAGTTSSGFKQYTKDASSQRIVGANPDGSPKIQQIKASKINIGNNLSEALARKVEIQKRKMFESNLVNGTVSVFKK